MSAAIILFFYLSRKKIVKTELEKASKKLHHQKEMLQTTINDPRGGTQTYRSGFA